MAWFARRDDGWEAASERVLAELGVPTERVDPTGPLPERGHRRPRLHAARARGRGAARPACRAGAGGAGRGARGADRARGGPSRRRRRGAGRRHAARGRRGGVGLRRLAGGPVRRPGVAAGDPPGGAPLRRRAGVARGAARVGRLRRRDVRHGRHRRPRLQGIAGPGGPADLARRTSCPRAATPRPRCAATSRAASPRWPTRPLNYARTLPLRAHARHPLHRLRPPRARAGLAGGRRLGPRLQARPRAGGGGGGRRCEPASRCRSGSGWASDRACATACGPRDS